MEQKVSGKTITHAWFRTTDMFKDDSVVGISKPEWDDLDIRIDAALRRAKAEGLREAVQVAMKYREQARQEDLSGGYTSERRGSDGKSNTVTLSV